MVLQCRNTVLPSDIFLCCIHVQYVVYITQYMVLLFRYQPPQFVPRTSFSLHSAVWQYFTLNENDKSKTNCKQNKSLTKHLNRQHRNYCMVNTYEVLVSVLSIFIYYWKLTLTWGKVGSGHPRSVIHCFYPEDRPPDPYPRPDEIV